MKIPEVLLLPPQNLPSGNWWFSGFRDEGFGLFGDFKIECFVIAKHHTDEEINSTNDHFLLSDRPCENAVTIFNRNKDGGLYSNTKRHDDAYLRMVHLHNKTYMLELLKPQLRQAMYQRNKLKIEGKIWWCYYDDNYPYGDAINFHDWDESHTCPLMVITKCERM